MEETEYFHLKVNQREIILELNNNTLSKVPVLEIIAQSHKKTRIIEGQDLIILI